MEQLLPDELYLDIHHEKDIGEAPTLATLPRAAGKAEASNFGRLSGVARGWKEE